MMETAANAIPFIGVPAFIMALWWVTLQYTLDRILQRARSRDFWWRRSIIDADIVEEDPMPITPVVSAEIGMEDWHGRELEPAREMA